MGLKMRCKYVVGEDFINVRPQIKRTFFFLTYGSIS